MKEHFIRKTGLGRLWELASMKKLLIFFACLLSVIGVVFSFTPFVALWFIVRELFLYVKEPSFMDVNYMVRLGWFAAGGAIGAVLFNFVALMCSHVAAFKTLYRLKVDFTRHLASLPLGFHSGNSTGKLRKVVDENIEKLEGFIAHQLPDLAGSLAAPLAVLFILFAFDWRLGLASFLQIFLAYALQMMVYGNKSSAVFIKNYQDSLEDMNNAAVEYVRGISVVKAFNQTVFSFRRFYDTIRGYGKFVFEYTMACENYMTVFMVIINNVYVLLIPVIIFISGRPGDYFSFALSSVFYLIFSMALPSVFLKLLYVSQTGRQIADGIERMDKILDIPSLPETEYPKTVNNYEVTFENVTFAYGSGREYSEVRDVSFVAPQGQVTALVGPSGSGKSTVAHLIPRFYDVAGGAVKIGGIDIRELSGEYLMSLVGFVFQDVFLFKQSIADNIRLGNEAVSMEQVILAARAAQCHEFIEKLPQGYETVIGTRNIHLSGGERQRLAIARAILKDAPVIVLDEATAFADPENEHKIHLAFERLMKNKTVIIVAHRLNTVRNANNIIVMDGGRVVECGRHGKLVAAGGRYSRMWQNYTSAMEWTVAGEGVPVHV